MSEALQAVAESRVGAFSLSPTGIRVVGTKVTYEEWVNIMEYLKTVHGAIQFWIGDAINIGEQEFREQASQILDAEEWSDETVRNYAWVSRSVSADRRQPRLSFTHHQMVAGLSPSAQTEWLEKSVRGEDGKSWSSTKLKEQLAEAAENKVLDYGLVIGGFESPASRDIAAQEFERKGHPVRKTFRTKAAERKAQEAEL